jgi:hypothetical protein
MKTIDGQQEKQHYRGQQKRAAHQHASLLGRYIVSEHRAKADSSYAQGYKNVHIAFHKEEREEPGKCYFEGKRCSTQGKKGCKNSPAPKSS